ncbi:MAG: maltodextrin glucosidase [Oscillibacter sp.]|jgi:cyclomaltodextrinase|nr:alpha-amylase family glycosyl hydrolase [uncultured Oscillibacter sp.]MCI8812160.1 maltodextrin glucosidase [Oscillibacter sp.]
MWADKSVFYQIYPLGFCGAPRENDGVPASRIGKIGDWAEHIRRLGADAVYLCPIFESDRHGYDTRDYRRVDCRLGTNEDFARVCESLHSHGVKVVLDGVFNHVGRGFWAFRDVQERKWDSPYKDWFHINFDGNSNYNDGFWYEGWEGHYELVKLNLRNPAVADYLLESVRLWVEWFGIDGLRLDVAYCLDKDFLRRLRSFCDGLKPEFFLVGETLHGDYNQWVGGEMLHSCTNYECYKGLYSALNSMNLFEIVHSLKRQFGPEQWTLYKGKHLLCFADNHDVTRAASILQNPAHLPLMYGILFGMPGIPCVYCGSEWGALGEKSQGDDALRPCFEAPQWSELTDRIAAMAKAHRESEALCFGDFRDLVLTNRQTVFQRRTENERVLVAVNADSQPYTAHFDAGCGQAVDLLTGKLHDFGGGSQLPPYSVAYWKCER